MNSFPHISVVTVCFNALDDLIKTNRSFSDQTYTFKEQVIIDGASKDGTVQWMNGLPKEGYVCISEPDNGIYDAMNKGVRYSSGEYIVFLNAGDTFPSSSTLEDVVNALQSYPDVLYGNHRVIDEFHEEEVQAYKPEDSWVDIRCCHQACYFKRSLLLQFPYSGKYICSDFEQMYDMHLAGVSFKYEPKIFAIFQHNGISSKRKVQIKSEILEILKVRKASSEDIKKANYLYRWTFVTEFLRNHLPPTFFHFIYTLKIRFFSKDKKKLYKTELS